MSNAVFPTLAGLTWDVTKTPQWNTKIQRSDGGKELRAQFYSTPLWRWVLAYDLLRGDLTLHEFQTLVGFYNARQGSFDSFLYADPNDSSVTAELFGFGNGAITTYQLIRSFAGTAEENVVDLNGTPQIFKNGVLQTSGFTIGSTGIVTFTTAPAPGDTLTWTGSYYWRTRFDTDAMEFNNFAFQLWEAKSVALVSVK
ncbi:MAG: DUF2460 domain-containing protein [Gemmatimonadales bacterium]